MTGEHPMASTRSLDLRNKIAARWPIIAINTHEPTIVLSEIEGIASNLKRHLFRWSATDGLVNVHGLIEAKDFAKYGLVRSDPNVTVAAGYFRTPIAVLRAALGFESPDDPDKGAIFVADNLHWYFTDKETRQLVIDLSSTLGKSRNKKTLIILGVHNEVPPELEKQVLVIDWPLPDADELRTIVQDHIEMSNSRSLLSEEVEFDEQMVSALVDALKGMTSMEAVNNLNEAMVKLRRLDASPEMLRALSGHKKQVIQKHQALEYFEPSEGINQIGGLDLLKQHLQEIIATHTAGATEFGVRSPLGILLVGLPGTGKTLLSRAAANEFHWPMVRLDLAAMFAGLVGQSESNMKSALAIIRAIAPVVVQIDEIEKAVSSRGGDMDGGTSSRVLGIVLTWLQDQMDDPNAPPMFIVATANRIAQLDSALIRRFEDTFFVDFPSAIEREEILAIHLRNAGRDPDALGIDLAMLADLSQDYSGAELKKAVDASLRKAYLSRLNGLAEDVTEDMIAEALEQIVPVSRSMAREINEMRRAAEQMRPASSGPRREPEPDDSFDEDHRERHAAVPDM
jgi:SpoVK/Ycf46/Vps4 family AAA+-type ATPase